MGRLKWLAVAVVVIGVVIGYQVYVVAPGFVEDGEIHYPVAQIEHGVTLVELNRYRLEDEWGRRFFYIVHLEGEYRALTGLNFLGCGVPFMEADQRFHDPCHGALYDVTGQHLSGPPDDDDYLGMDILRSEVRNGHLVVINEVRPWSPWPEGEG